MSIAERLAVQTINGSEQSMLDRVGGFHDRLPFFFGASRGPPHHATQYKKRRSAENLTGIDQKNLQELATGPGRVAVKYGAWTRLD
jgi:hypothetical protein